LTKTVFLQEIILQCSEITLQRPVVLIADEMAAVLHKSILSKGIPTEGLF
jgi:hypothetical protein